MTTALVIGAGPAGLMAAETLSSAGLQVTLVDKMPSVGRKFLMAGKSGLNLTKAEPADVLETQFHPGAPQLLAALRDFGSDAVQAWAQGLGQDLFAGSTGRVFPKAMKASPLLRAWMQRLSDQGVTLRTRWNWTGWTDNAATFATPDGPQSLAADVTILALGGASWARLGSDGAWADQIAQTVPFQPANMGILRAWSDHMTSYIGQPVKGIGLTAGSLRSRGEIVLSQTGIEGGGVYEVSRCLRDGDTLVLDLLPDLSMAEIESRWSRRRQKATFSNFLKSGLRLPPVKIALFNEISQQVKPENAAAMLALLKALPVSHDGPVKLDLAISTAGGVQFAALNDGFMLRDRPGVFCAGEMLDWEAPTGGYLITACLATGRAAALAALDFHKKMILTD